jgi:anti-repressor protein
MNELQVFKNEQFGEIRWTKINGKDFAVGVDVARALGYSNPSKAVIQHCKGVTKTGIPSSGGIQETNVIPEGDIYRLTAKSELPGAEKFETWIFDEVLPSIRKTGGYIPTLEEDDEASIMAKALMIAQKTISKKDELIQKQSQELESKNKFINQIAVSENSLLVEEVAAIASKNGIKIGRNRLWDKLREWKLIKETSRYDPKQKYIDNGYFEVAEGAKETSKGTFTYKTTRVTGKGQVYIINRLIKEKEAC